MNRRTMGIRAQVLALAGETFIDVARSHGTGTLNDLISSWTSLGASLAPQIRQIDRDAHVEFLNELMTDGLLISSALTDLESQEGDTVSTAGRLSDGLHLLADTLVIAAASFPDKTPRPADQSLTASGYDTPAGLREQSAALALQVFNASVGLSEAVGLAVADAPLEFRLVRGRRCGSDEAALADRLGARGVFVNHRPLDPAKVDGDRLRATLGDLERLRPNLAEGLERLGQSCMLRSDPHGDHWHAVCDDDCTFPGKPVPTATAFGAVAAGLGAFQPTMDVSWDFCCRNWCALFWWETFISTAATTVNVGNPVNGRAAAIATATRLGPAMLARLAAPANPC